jgi:hypothetical protein
MNICKRVEHRRKQLAHFIRREGALRKDLRKVLFRSLHDNEKKRRSFQFATAGFKHANKVRVGKLPRLLPAAQLGLRVSGIGGNKFDRGFLRGVGAALSEKHSAVV